MRRKYSKDWLMSLRDAHSSWPAGLEAAEPAKLDAPGGGHGGGIGGGLGGGHGGGLGGGLGPGLGPGLGIGLGPASVAGLRALASATALGLPIRTGPPPGPIRRDGPAGLPGAPPGKSLDCSLFGFPAC